MAAQIGDKKMTTLTCTWIGKGANEHRTYWIIGKEYTARETKTMFMVKDEFGLERKVSKKTMALTGFTNEVFATTFS